MKIIVVDDEKLIAEDISDEVLALFPSASVETVTSADEAIGLAKTTPFDVALLDIDMPKTDGLTLARKLIALLPSINIIFITGHKEYSLEAHELYCSAFLLKPVGEKKLKQAFEHLRKPFVDLPEEFYAQHYQGGDAIGKKIEMYRKLRGISRQEMADLMAVTRQTVYRWEQGERLPDILTFLSLARILGIEINDML